MKQRRLGFAIHDLNSWGGQDRSVMEIARRLSRRFDVDIFSYSLNDPLGQESWGVGTRFHSIRPYLQKPFVTKMGIFYGATLPHMILGPMLKGERRPLIHATGTCSLLADVVQIQFIAATWEEEQKKILLNPAARRAYSPPFARGANGAKARALGFYHQALNRYDIWKEHQFYQSDKTYIVIARRLAEEMKNHFGITKKIHVIHHGVDSEQFRPATTSADFDGRKALRAQWRVREDESVAIFVGAYERKGLAPTIEALASLSEAHRKKVRLVAVGDGAVSGFEDLARELGVAEQVVFIQHQKDVAPYYRAADFFILPTFYEPFGLVILEAMASGLAPLVSRGAGASELIEDGNSGLLIQDPVDARAIASQIGRWITKPDERKRVGEAARAIAVARSWDRVADEYANVLNPELTG